MSNNPSGFWMYHGEELDLTQELKDLCKLLLQEDPEKRGTMTDLICHPWMWGEKITQEEFAEKYDKIMESTKARTQSEQLDIDCAIKHAQRVR